MNRYLFIPAAIVAALAVAGVAWANPSTASASCQGGVVYEGHDYPPSGNTVRIYWDGNVVKTVTFGTATSGTVANPDKTAAHTWSVVWDRFNGTDGDRTQSGTVAACAAVVPASTTTTTLPPPTTTTLVATDDELTPVDTTTTLAPPPVVVAVGDPVVPVPQGVMSAGQTLPATGLRGDLMWVAALTVLAGFVLVLITRRRTA